MATSGTVGRTTIDVASIVELAASKCGAKPSVMTAEMLERARLNLFLLLTSLAVKGINLWCVEKQLHATVRSRVRYALLDGTEDVERVLLRRGTAVDATSYASGLVSLTAASALRVVSVIVQPAAAGTYTVTLQSSTDGVTWTTCGSATATTTADAPAFCIDADPAATVAYWRITSSAATYSSVRFLHTTREVEMGKLARGAYQQLPDKTTPGTPLEYWFDKQTTPALHVWQPTDEDYQQLVVWAQRQIQDVGALSNTLDLPQRWLEPIIVRLAASTALELPAAELPPGRLEYLEGKAAELERSAADSETDGAPVRLVPKIGAYTRG